jgi:hypothetical protein
LLIAIPLLTGSASADPRADAKTKVESLWADLLSANDTTVFRTVLALAGTPKETLAFFKDNLHPVKIDSKRVERLIADLDSSDAAVAQRADVQLEYLGKYVRPELHKALAQMPSLALRQRIEALLKRLPHDPLDQADELFAELKKDPKNKTMRDKLIKVLNGSLTPAAGASPLWLRARRAIMVLEHIATPEARDQLKALADGEPDALPTKEAKAALERLANPAAARGDSEAVPVKDTAAPATTDPLKPVPLQR